MLFFALLITMTVPFEVLVLPLFVLVRGFPLAGGNDLFGNGGVGLMNSYAGIVFPHLVTVYGVFIFRQFFLGFPKELEDAARIDGASRTRIYWSLLMPNSAPVIGTMGLFAFLWAWNDPAVACDRRQREQHEDAAGRPGHCGAESIAVGRDDGGFGDDHAARHLCLSTAPALPGAGRSHFRSERVESNTKFKGLQRSIRLFDESHHGDV